MPRYRKKPVEVEALQFDGSSSLRGGILAWMEGGACPRRGTLHTRDSHRSIEIETLEGTMVARAGDYIIKGVNGEFYPCKPDIFEKTYEEVSDEG